MSRMYRFNPLLPERRSHALQKTHRIDYTTSHAVMRVKVIKYHDANVLLIPARDHVAVSSVCQRRTLLRALFCRETAPGPESASGRHTERTGNISLEYDPLGALRDIGIRDRNRGEQGLCIRVDRAVIEFIRVSCLHNSSQIHDRDSVGNMPDDQKVVRDKEVRDAQFLLKFFKHVDDLSLDRNVQRGYSLVADDKSGIHGQRSGDTDTLSLSAGELVYISCGVLRVKSDQLHKTQDLLSSFLAV